MSWLYSISCVNEDDFKNVCHVSRLCRDDVVEMFYSAAGMNKFESTRHVKTTTNIEIEKADNDAQPSVCIIPTIRTSADGFDCWLNSFYYQYQSHWTVKKKKSHPLLT